MADGGAVAARMRRFTFDEVATTSGCGSNPAAAVAAGRAKGAFANSFLCQPLRDRPLAGGRGMLTVLCIGWARATIGVGWRMSTCSATILGAIGATRGI